ncbi:MAG: hypothetical protein AAFP15_17895, partial [Bacteroidota bacterium]
VEPGSVDELSACVVDVLSPGAAVVDEPVAPPVVLPLALLSAAVVRPDEPMSSGGTHSPAFAGLPSSP